MGRMSRFRLPIDAPFNGSVSCRRLHRAMSERFARAPRAMARGDGVSIWLCPRRDSNSRTWFRKPCRKRGFHQVARLRPRSPSRPSQRLPKSSPTMEDEMSRPLQDVKVFGIQDRRANAQAKRPWIVRRMIDGQQRSTSFRTRGEADRDPACSFTLPCPVRNSIPERASRCRGGQILRTSDSTTGVDNGSVDNGQNGSREPVARTSRPSHGSSSSPPTAARMSQKGSART